MNCKYWNEEYQDCSVDNNTYEQGYNQALDDFRKLANEHMVDSEAIGDFVLTDGSIDYIIDTLKR